MTAAKRGICLIVNNQDFSKSKQGLLERMGTKVDEGDLMFHSFWKSQMENWYMFSISALSVCGHIVLYICIYIHLCAFQIACAKCFSGLALR